jgi:hypothetical protein
MFEFDEWPYPLVADLRIVRRRGPQDDEAPMIYSLAMDAYTQVSREEIAHLKDEGVQEITDSELA